MWQADRGSTWKTWRVEVPGKPGVLGAAALLDSGHQDYAGRVGQLVVRAIDPRLKNGLKGFLLGMIRGARWELTCGFCKQQFQTLQHLFSQTADCPFCGTRNLLVGGGPQPIN